MAGFLYSLILDSGDFMPNLRLRPLKVYCYKKDSSQSSFILFLLLSSFMDLIKILLSTNYES